MRCMSERGGTWCVGDGRAVCTHPRLVGESGGKYAEDAP